MTPPSLLRLNACAVDLDRGVVLRDGSTQTLTDQERALLMMLTAQAGRAVSRDDLLQEVWDQDDPSLTRAVDIAIRRLRQKIEAQPSRPEHLITVRGEGYQYTGEGRAFSEPSPTTGQVINARLNLSCCAVDLTTGLIERAKDTLQLTPQELALLNQLVQQAGQPVSRDDLLIRVWKQEDPGLSRAVDLAMRRLRKKLESNPSKPTHFVTIRGQGYQYNGKAPVQTAVVAESHRPKGRTNLAAATDLFVGRGADLDALSERFDAERRLVTLVGPPGIGKTRVARQFGRRVVEHYPGGVWFCDLTEARTPAGVTLAIAYGLGVSLTGRQEDAAQTIARALQERGCTLVILDNAEQVAEALVESLKTWLDLETHWLVTSRVILNLPQEHRYTLEPLGRLSGAALFTNRARLANRRLDWSRIRRSEVHQLVETLEGIPLAIELAAARMHKMTLPELQEKLSNQLQVLRLRQPNMSSLKATLQGSLEWSWQLLEPYEQAALAQCAVFRGGFDLEAADAVVDLSPWPDAPWTPDVIQRLVDHSLIRTYEPEKEPGVLRFNLYASIQAFCENRLDTLSGRERRGLWERHANWYANYRTQKSRVDAALAREFDNIHSALQRALTYSWFAQIADCGIAMAHSFMGRGPYVRAQQVLAQVLDALPDDYVDRGELLMHQSDNLHILGDIEGANDALQNAIECHRKSGNRDLEAHSLQRQAVLLRRLRQNDRALAQLQQALAIHRENDNQSGEALTLYEIAGGEIAAGHIETGLETFRVVEKIWKTQGNHSSLGRLYGTLAGVEVNRAEYAKSKEYCLKAIQLLEQTGEKRPIHAYTCTYGIAQLNLGEYAKAHSTLTRALEMAVKVNDRIFGSNMHVYLGQVCIETLQLNLAIEHLNTALEMHLEFKDVARIAWNKLALGRALLLTGQVGLADTHLNAGLEAFKNFKIRRLEAGAWGLLARLHHVNNAPKKAMDACLKSIAINEELNLPVHGMHTLRGRIELVLQNPSDALPCFETALHLVGDRYGRNEVLAEQGRALVLNGQLGAGRVIVQHAVQALREEESLLRRVRGLFCLAEVEHLGNDREASQQALDEAQQLLKTREVPDASPLQKRVWALQHLISS